METEYNKRTVRHEYLPMFIITAGWFLLRISFFVGVRAIDHFVYVQKAHAIVGGVLTPNGDSQSVRLAILFPMALFQSLFGINDASAVMYSMCCSLGCLWLAYAFGKMLFNRRSGYMAASLFACFPLDIIQGTTLFPDVIGAFWAFLALYLFMRAEREEESSWRLYLLSGVVLGIGFMCRMTVIFMIPVMVALFMFKWRWRNEYFILAMSFGLMLLLDMFFFYILTEDASFRYHATSRNGFIMREVFYPTAADLQARMLWAWPSILFFPFHRQSSYFLLYTWFLLPAIFFLRYERNIQRLCTIFIVTLLCIWFWPISIAPYIPAIVPDGRFLILLGIPLCLIVGVWLCTLRRWVRVSMWVLLCLSSMISTAMIHEYLTTFDRGERDAFNILQKQNVKEIAIRDGLSLYQYLSQYDASYSIKKLYYDDLATLTQTYVVLDNRYFLRRNPHYHMRMYIAQYTNELDRWEKVWSREYAHRSHPIRRLMGQNPGTYTVSIYRVP